MGKYDPAPTPAAGIVRLARSKANLTQAQLAELAGITQQAVSAYETGRLEPTLESLRRLVRAAGFEMTIRLEPLDEHDSGLERFLETLSPETRAEVERSASVRAAEARLRRVRGK